MRMMKRIVATTNQDTIFAHHPEVHVWRGCFPNQAIFVPEKLIRYWFRNHCIGRINFGYLFGHIIQTFIPASYYQFFCLYG